MKPWHVGGFANIRQSRDEKAKAMNWETWMAEAHKAGEHYWAYREFVMDNPDGARAAFEAGMDPYEYIKSEGQRLDLHEFGPAWGGW